MIYYSLSFAFLLIASSMAVAKVVGGRVEAIGKEAPRLSWGDWLETPNALMTAPTLHLATQSCFRESQKKIDIAAFSTVAKILQNLQQLPSLEKPSYQGSVAKLAVALLGLQEAVNVTLPRSAQNYVPMCDATLSGLFLKFDADLRPLFSGRSEPITPERLRLRGLKIAPLDYAEIPKQACKLQGYYSTSRDAKLWLLYTWTKVLGLVLVKESEADAFIASILPVLNEETRDLLHRINQYSSVAGSYNGAVIDKNFLVDAPRKMRTTGTARGSSVPGILATFTTPWRESIESHLYERPYDENTPFQLLSANEILASLKSNYVVVGPFIDTFAKAISPTGIGMYQAYSFLTQKKSLSSAYEKAVVFSWLTMNAETNIRQNEAIAGPVAGSAPPPPTSLVLGDPESYQLGLLEIALAKGAYAQVDPEREFVDSCVAKLETYYRAASKVKVGEVVNLPPEIARTMMLIEIEPVIANLGLEVSDPQDGEFYLHLATGLGRSFALEVLGKEYSVWAPSAYLMHNPTPLSTADWVDRTLKTFEDAK